MSHIVVIETRVHDAAAPTAACRRLGLAEPVHGIVRLFSADATGLSVKLPGWHTPLWLTLRTGRSSTIITRVGGAIQKNSGQLLQMYAVEKAKIEARKKGTASLSKFVKTAASCSRSSPDRLRQAERSLGINYFLAVSSVVSDRWRDDFSQAGSWRSAPAVVVVRRCRPKGSSSLARCFPSLHPAPEGPLL